MSTEPRHPSDIDKRDAVERERRAAEHAGDFDGLTVEEAERLAESLALSLRLLTPGQLQPDDVRYGRVTAYVVNGRLRDASAT